MEISPCIERIGGISFLFIKEQELLLTLIPVIIYECSECFIRLS